MSTQEPIIEVRNIELTYKSLGLFKQFQHQAIRDVSFRIAPGEILGVVGRNGCGKSSLLQILADLVAPTSGEIIAKPRLTRALLSVGLGFNPNLKGRDNAVFSAMLQGASKAEARALEELIKEFSELGEFFDQPVKTYSSGMKSRLGFATALMVNVDLLLVDETLSVGDASFNTKAENAMLEKMNGEQTVVFVSHNARQVQRLCSRALWLEKGTIMAEGGVDEVAEQYDAFMAELKKSAPDRRGFR